jgi:MoaA/NifB/PqqE/SkfB family radical SAM enzyme
VRTLVPAIRFGDPVEGMISAAACVLIADDIASDGELLVRTVARLRAHGAFCGGEPLLVKRLPEYARRQREAGKRTVLNTNGELLSRRFSSVADLPFDIVGISLDGPDAVVHQAMRGANANFARTLAAIRWLAADDLVKLKTATVVSNINIGHIPRLARLVREIRPALWRLYQYRTRPLSSTG